MIMLNNNLRIFITAAELESLTEAAKKLYISQPAISQAIRKLEEELNVKLFIRNKRNKLTLTDVGKEILALAFKMADLENRLYQTAYEENHLMGGIVRIATVPVGASLILSRVLPIFKNQFPGVTVELLEGIPDALNRIDKIQHIGILFAGTSAIQPAEGLHGFHIAQFLVHNHGVEKRFIKTRLILLRHDQHVALIVEHGLRLALAHRIAVAVHVHAALAVLRAVNLIRVFQ